MGTLKKQLAAGNTVLAKEALVTFAAINTLVTPFALSENQRIDAVLGIIGRTVVAVFAID